MSSNETLVSFITSVTASSIADTANLSISLPFISIVLLANFFSFEKGVSKSVAPIVSASPFFPSALKYDLIIPGASSLLSTAAPAPSPNKIQVLLSVQSVTFERNFSSNY